MKLMERLGFAPAITPPAIWGRLPAHADMVRSGMRKGERGAWEGWLALQDDVIRAGGPGPATIVLPTSFVLPPGALSSAVRQCVVGVAMPSMDRAGCRHILLVYQIAGLRWVQRYFAMHAQQPCDWLFWLGRAMSRHAALAEAADVWALARAVEALWQLHAPVGARLGVPWRRGAIPDPDRAHALLERLLGLPPMNDPAARMMGVRYLPWNDWPEGLCDLSTPGAPGVFWQQDANGGFVNAARRLDILWSAAS